jgi:two-component system nitrogen regulation response regulator GlnG
MKPIWIVDDDQSIRWVLEKALARESLATRSFANVREALGALDHETPQVLVSDIRMPGASGLELLQSIRERLPELPVIIMTAYSDLDSAVAAFQGGAFEYLAKPFDIDRAVELIHRAVDESLRGTHAADVSLADAPEMLGQAPAMQDMFRAIGRLSHSSATVLITGESGTGKELVARALHRHSPRANGPFIALNTAAIPKDLLESELFGHERGAFTGAQAMRQGRFEQAENGTLFLDEIGDMPFDLQTRLLRVLSDGQFYRVGGHNPLRANVRVIAATHQNLESRVRQGLFREDLYHRLNVIRLRLPPLRERKEDIPLLTRHFLQKSARDLGVEPKRVSEATLAYLASLPFPGNVRQLENLANWLTVMAPAQTIEIKDLPPDLMPPSGEGAGEIVAGPAAVTQAAAGVMSFDGGGSNGVAIAAPPSAGALGGVSTAVPVSVWESGLRTEVARMLRENTADVMDELARRFEAAVIREALDFTRGRKVEAAERLGIGRNTITRKIQELHLEP